MVNFYEIENAERGNIESSKKKKKKRQTVDKGKAI